MLKQAGVDCYSELNQMVDYHYNKLINVTEKGKKTKKRISHNLLMDPIKIFYIDNIDFGSWIG